MQQGSFALDQVNFRVDRGQYAVMMGKTGCGKTSILEAICGLRGIAGGTIVIEDSDVTALPPALRGIGYVPQDGALFPTMTVEDQIGFALYVRRRAPQEIAARVRDLAEM
ncbi:MAG: ABC transporter ATP-binding protein, partial [Planctomycetales bacterium]|nr:ABC transporter ATP-binding protein [Planctomycetales bacterium]